MNYCIKVVALLLASLASLSMSSAQSNNLFKDGNWANLSADNRASQIGDVLTVIVFQSAEARNSAMNASRKRTNYQGSIAAGGLAEGGQLSLESDFTGQGDVRRSESFVTQFSVSIIEALPNGDFVVAGSQQMLVNGDETIIEVSGRVRPFDITTDNEILSTQIADATIVYDGDSFAMRSAKPSFLHRLFSLLGLGL